MGGSTQVVPTTSNTQQQVEVPDYIKNAGQAATNYAENFASQPYTPFSGQMVAPLSGNQYGAEAMAAGSTNTGQDTLGVAKGALGAAGTVANGATGAYTPALNNAGVLAQQQGADALTDRNAGQGNLAAGSQNGSLADALARLSQGAGKTAIDTGADAATSLVGTAAGTQNAGMDSASLGAALARLAGGSAVANDNAGASDLNDARGYNAESASPVTAGQISNYFDPYVQDALNPVLANLNRTNQQTNALADSKAAMTGSFGGSRTGLVESQNNKNYLNQVATTTGQGYSDAYDKALSASQADKLRQGTAAGTSINIAAGANTEANDALSRLTQAATSNANAGTNISDLTTAGQNRSIAANNAAINAGTSQSQAATAALQRLLDSSKNEQGLATTASDLATASGQRLGAAAQGETNLATATSQLSTDDVNRLLSLINPSESIATTESGLTNDAINRLLTTGGVEQTYNQNVDNANYQQYQNSYNDQLTKLNALIAAAGGVPYGTSTTSNTQGTQVVQTPSILGQLAGAAGTVAGAAIASNRDWKEDFEAVDEEDILKKFRNLPVEGYRYKPEVRDAIGDDGRTHVGPMAQDFASEFGGNGKIIPMPELMGAMVAAVRALERRTDKMAA